MKIKSDQIVYSEHGEDECFEYTNGSGRVPDGVAIGYAIESNAPSDVIVLFDDIKYSECDHDYWDNHELEHDVDRVVVG
tara:strand:+ start:3525 stop:3761 length:237 start_codon:yes stop_codon:yes gene_type:complete